VMRPSTRSPSAWAGTIVEAGAIGAIIYAEGKVACAGFANLQTAARMAPKHRTRVGSIDKTYLAVVAVTIFDELDVPAARWLPELDERITLRHLLSHRSGLFDSFAPWPKRSRSSSSRRLTPLADAACFTVSGADNRLAGRADPFLSRTPGRPPAVCVAAQTLRSRLRASERATDEPAGRKATARRRPSHGQTDRARRARSRYPESCRGGLLECRSPRTR
jgi:CubicO group peptidase (beta-lactamase class C family)